MSDLTPTISVVVPAYNAERFLPSCLASVFAQTLPPDEVIVVDDGSTDATARVAEQLGARVIRQPNSGQAAARNVGIQKSSGDWIALLDADDLWEPAKLALQVAAIRSDTILVYTGIQFFDERGPSGLRYAVNPQSARKMLRYRNPITPSTVLVLRKAVLDVGGFDVCAPPCEDWDMWVRLLPYGQLAAVSEPLTQYRLSPQSSSASPERMLSALSRIIEGSLLAGLRGLSRWVWRRRIWATQLRSAALIARDNHLNGELRYLLRSLVVWPSPFWQPGRFANLAVSLRNRLLFRWNTAAIP